MSPKHYSEDDLTLYYYAEGRFSGGALRRTTRRRVERHLEECSTCAALYQEIAGTLAFITDPAAPDRGDQYGLEIWQRLRHVLPEQDGLGFGHWVRWDRFAIAVRVAGLVILIGAAFMAGRTWRQAGTTVTPSARLALGTATSPATTGVSSDPAYGAAGDPRKRILLTSIADHLDRSERVLTDIMHGGDHNDISSEQRWADDLLTAGRFYRQDALEAGEQSVASVLDELERGLLDIVHSPSQVRADDLEQIRRRIDAAALLFKVRVMSDELRVRDESSISTSKTS